MNLVSVSIFLLWLAVIGLSLLVLALTRQIGLLHERISPAGALSLDKHNIKTGEAAPVLELESIAGQVTRIGGEHSDGRSTLLFFLSDTCPVCKTLLPTLKSMRKDESDWLDIVLASDGDPDAHMRFVTKAGLSGFSYLLSEELGRSYEIGKLPYGVLIDEHGMLVTHGLVNTREHLESLLEARKLGVASIQEFAAQSAA